MNLFDITPDCQNRLGGVRTASDDECKAYMRWQQSKLGLHAFEAIDLEWRGSRRRGQDDRRCIGATFGAETERASHTPGRWERREEGDEYFPGTSTPAQYENGAYSVLMPGHDAHRARVTMETLDEAGEVVTSQTLPVEPKKGGVIWSREAVRKAHGPIAKVKRGKAGKAAADADPIPVHAEPIASASQSGQDSEGEAPVAQEGGEAIESRDGAYSGSDYGGVESQGTPAPVDIEVNSPDPDPIAELFARMAALEARLDTLPGESIATPTPRARRTPAHERAIRRAWAERKARRRADFHIRIGVGQLDAMRAERDAARQTMDMTEEALRDMMAKRRRAVLLARRNLTALWGAKADYREEKSRHGAEWAKRQRSTILARQRGREMATLAGLVRTASQAETFQRQRGDVLHAQLVRLRADMADPMQPERASDLSRLVRERDEARNAAAATAARNEQMQAAVDRMAGEFEALAVRVARAEAAVRRGLAA